MGDNVLVGTTPTFATDADDGQSPAVHYPIQKLAFGVLNTFTLVSSSAGLPVAQQGTWVVSLPSGAATAAKQPALGTAGTASADVVSVQGIASMTALKVDGSAVTQPVSGTFWQATQPVSAAALPLPSGAATLAKQPALGTAGTASADVITVQGIASMTALKVDGSAVTQPVSDGGGSLTVDGSVSVSGVVPGTTASSLGKAEDAAAADGDTGVMALAVRKDTAATTVGTDGDYHPLEVNANGRLWCSTLIDTALPAGANVIGAVTQSGTWNVGTVTTLSTLTTITNAVHVDDNSASLTVDAPVGTPVFVRLSDGASAIATLPVSIASLPSGAVTNAGVFGVQNTATATSSGVTLYHAVSAGSNNAASVKASAGQVYGVQCFNINASPRYLKFYDKASSPTPASDTVVKSILIPGNTAGGGVVIKFDPPIPFATGISLACITGIGDTDNTSTSASEVIINVDYK